MFPFFPSILSYWPLISRYSGTCFSAVHIWIISSTTPTSPMHAAHPRARDAPTRTRRANTRTRHTACKRAWRAKANATHEPARMSNQRSSRPAPEDGVAHAVAGAAARPVPGAGGGQHTDRPLHHPGVLLHLQRAGRRVRQHPAGGQGPPPRCHRSPPETQGTVRSAVWCRIFFAEKGIYKYMYICMEHREQWQLNPFNGRHFYGRACNPLQNIRLSAFLLFQERWLFFFLGRGVLGHKSNLWDKKMIALNHFNIFCLQNYAEKFLRREEEEILRKTFSFSGV